MFSKSILRESSYTLAAGWGVAEAGTGTGAEAAAGDLGPAPGMWTGTGAKAAAAAGAGGPNHVETRLNAVLAGITGVPGSSRGRPARAPSAGGGSGRWTPHMWRPPLAVV